MINSIEIENVNGLVTNGAVKLERVVLLVGKNGAGKSRLLNMIGDKFNGVDDRDGFEIALDEGDFNIHKCKYKIANYSHYDILLQSPRSFIPDVISGAQARLNDCNYENTATDALLFIYDMAFGYSDYCISRKDIFAEFQDHARKFELEIKKNEVDRSLLICEDSGENNKPLSPGQRYLLRMAVASFRKKLADRDNIGGGSGSECICDPNYIFLIDEPEIHLHPDALIKVLNTLINNFKDKAQFFIATHSLALASHFVVSAATESATKILWFEKGKINDFRSDSTKLIDGLIGEESNRLAINNLIRMPDDFACNLFAVQCLNEPESVSVDNRQKQDKTTCLATEVIMPHSVVLDYGVGKGRFIESLKTFHPEKLAKIDYYAYDKFPDDGKICKKIMSDCFASVDEYDIEKHYTNDFNEYFRLFKQQDKVDIVFMINVLHEIPVSDVRSRSDWKETFINIRKVLKKDGKLVIVEREELTVGEAPYANGYVMLTEGGARSLFGKKVAIKRWGKADARSEDISQAEGRSIDERGNILHSPIIRYVIDGSALSNITDDKIRNCLTCMETEAKEVIRQIHERHKEQESHIIETEKIEKNWRFKNGIRLAFWVHQFANVTINLDAFDIKNTSLNTDVQ